MMKKITFCVRIIIRTMKNDDNNNKTDPCQEYLMQYMTRRIFGSQHVRKV